MCGECCEVGEVILLMGAGVARFVCKQECLSACMWPSGYLAGRNF